MQFSRENGSFAVPALYLPKFTLDTYFLSGYNEFVEVDQSIKMCPNGCHRLVRETGGAAFTVAA